MPQSARSLSMRSRPPEKRNREWFRVENAFHDEENSDTNKAVIYIYDEIGSSWWGDSTSADDFVKMLSGIRASEIELHLNSPGGDIFDGVAIYNALKAHSASVTVIVDALAASAASFIAQAGDKIVMTKAATMMIHDGSALAWGPAAVMRETADLLDKLSNTVAEIYADNAGESVEFWRNMMIEEMWYNSHEAVEAGLADEIGEDTKKEDDEAAQNKWDFSVFNYAGRRDAPDPLAARQRIVNQLTKEAPVTRKVTNTETSPEETPPPADPAPTEETPPAPTEEVEEEETEEGTDPPVVEPPKNKVMVVNNRPTFVVRGVPTNDHQAVQNRLDELETFRDESLKAGKISFVEKLAADNKILASQIPGLMKYVNRLDDEGYAEWKNTWDGAASIPMLQTKSAGASDSTGTESQAGKDAADEIEIKKGIVKNHQNSGMKDEVIMKTPSYQRLMELDPTFKL